MASTGAVERNKKIKKFVAIYKQKRQDLKKLIQNTYKEALQMQDLQKRKEKIHEVFKLQGKLDHLTPWSMQNRYRNRCEVTGDPRSYFRAFGLGRNYLRLNVCTIPGFKKLSW